MTLEVPLACFVLELTDDDIIEDAESFVLQLSSSDPSVIVTNNNTVTIIIEDNDCMLMLDTIVSALHVYMYMYMHLHTKSGVSFYSVEVYNYDVSFIMNCTQFSCSACSESGV